MLVALQETPPEFGALEKHIGDTATIDVTLHQGSTLTVQAASSDRIDGTLTVQAATIDVTLKCIK